MESKTFRLSCRSCRIISLNIHGAYVIFFFFNHLFWVSQICCVVEFPWWKMPAVGKMILSPSWSNLGVLINSIYAWQKCISPEVWVNWISRGKVAPFPLREEGCELFLNYIKVFMHGLRKGWWDICNMKVIVVCFFLCRKLKCFSGNPPLYSFLEHIKACS